MIRSVEFLQSPWFRSALACPWAGWERLMGCSSGGARQPPCCPLCQDQAVPPASTSSLLFLVGAADACSHLRAGAGGTLCMCSSQRGVPGLFLLYPCERPSRREGSERQQHSGTAGGLTVGRPGLGEGTSLWKSGACPEGRTWAMPDSWHSMKGYRLKKTPSN